MLFLILAMIFIEGTIVTVPLTFSILLVLFLLYKRDIVLVYAFVAGLLLDALTVRVIGSTSLFFCIILGIILLYQRKFEITSLFFLMITSFIGSFLYGLLFGLENLVLQSVISVIISVMFFLILHKRINATALH
jgi:rod shape-determining protein MreD